MPGPGPISSDTTCRTTDYDALLHEATTVSNAPAIPANVHLDSAAPAVAGDALPIVGGAIDTATDVAALAAEGGSGSGAVFAVGAAGPGVALALGLAEVAHADQEGRRGAAIHDRGVLEGALAAMEGRASDPRVVERRRTDPGFDEGFRRVDQFNREHPARCASILAAVQASTRAGTQSVVTGRDCGAEFECRYRQDVVFHHAVDGARADQAADPAAFARQQALATDVARLRSASTRG